MRDRRQSTKRFGRPLLIRRRLLAEIERLLICGGRIGEEAELSIGPCEPAQRQGFACAIVPEASRSLKQPGRGAPVGPCSSPMGKAFSHHGSKLAKRHSRRLSRAAARQ